MIRNIWDRFTPHTATGRIALTTVYMAGLMSAVYLATGVGPIPPMLGSTGVITSSLGTTPAMLLSIGIALFITIVPAFFSSCC